VLAVLGQDHLAVQGHVLVLLAHGQGGVEGLLVGFLGLQALLGQDIDHLGGLGPGAVDHVLLGDAAPDELQTVAQGQLVGHLVAGLRGQAVDQDQGPVLEQPGLVHALDQVQGESVPAHDHDVSDLLHGEQSFAFLGLALHQEGGQVAGEGGNQADAADHDQKPHEPAAGGHRDHVAVAHRGERHHGPPEGGEDVLAAAFALEPGKAQGPRGQHQGDAQDELGGGR